MRGESSRVRRGDRRHGARHHGSGHGAAGLGGLADRGDQLRHQPEQPAHVPVRAEQRRGPTGRRWWRCTTAPAPGPALLLRHRVRLPGRPVRLHRHLPVGDPQRHLLRRLLAAGAAGTTAAATRSASCRWSTTSSSQQRRPDRVYVTGASSGGMMTNVLLGDYPDVFKAGAAFMGVPFGCFATTDGSELEQRRAPAAASPRPRSSGATWSAAPTPATPARGRGCSCGTAPPTPPCATPTSAKRSSSGPTSSGVSQTPAFTDRPQSELDPHPLRRHRRHGAGRGDQHPGRRAQPADRRHGRGGHRVLRPDRRPRPPAPHPRRPATHHPDAHHAATPTRHAVALPVRCRVTYTMNAWNTGLTTAVTDHQHRHHPDQRLVPGVHPARRADHHLRLERHLLAGQRPGDGQERLLQRHHRGRAPRPASASRPPTPATPANPPRSPSTAPPAPRAERIRAGARGPTRA